MIETYGRLIYVMGPSGAGKDSVLKAARVKAPSHVLFAHRYITRPSSDASENHVELSLSEFENRLQHDCFCLNWSSHGLRYGIGNEVDNWRQNGCDVVVNGSRQALDVACERYPELLPVIITADDSVLAARLKARGRESDNHIQARLSRNQSLDIRHPDLITITNNGQLSVATDTFLKILNSPR